MFDTPKIALFGLADVLQCRGFDNQSITALIKGYKYYGPDSMAGWKGPFLAVKYRQSKPTRFVDLDPTDFQHIIEHFAKVYTIFESDEPHPIVYRNPREWTKAVVRSSGGGTTTKRTETFREVYVRRDHKIFKENEWDALSSVSKAVGMTLVIKVLPQSKNHGVRNGQPSRNGVFWSKNICTLLLSVDQRPSKIKHWGKVSARFEPVFRRAANYSSTCLIARKDGRDLSIDQLEALVHFIDKTVKPQLQKLEDVSMREVYLKSLRLQHEEFFAGYKEEKIRLGHSGWKHVDRDY